MRDQPGPAGPADPSVPFSQRRFAVVDLGSNSVRLVVFEGLHRNPRSLFNEKAVLRLGRGVAATGRMSEQAMAEALVVMDRYAEVVRAMHAETFEVLATAAVRDAANGPDFVRDVESRLRGVKVRILSGDDEAMLSASGVLCGIPHAHGVLADIGGGSLELVRLDTGHAAECATLGLGVIRLAERSNNDLVRARALAEADLATIPFLSHAAGGDLYLVGGAFRALARIHMLQIGYPLTILHHYCIRREEARDLTAMIASIGRRGLERLPGISRRRLDDLPFAAVVLRRVLRATNARRVVFSASGLREGWLFQQMPQSLRAEDPLLAACRTYAATLSRDPALPPALIAWTASLFGSETKEQTRLREAACYLSDCASQDHPDYRAEHAYLRVLRQPSIGLDHHARAFLALATAIRYEADPASPLLAPARLLLDVASATRAECLGATLRLAYTLSAGTPDLLNATRLFVRGGQLVLRLSGTGAFAGEGVLRRVDAIAQAMGLEAATEFG